MSNPIKNPIYLNSKPRRKSRLYRPRAAKSQKDIEKIAELERRIATLETVQENRERREMNRKGIQYLD